MNTGSNSSVFSKESLWVYIPSASGMMDDSKENIQVLFLCLFSQQISIHDHTIQGGGYCRKPLPMSIPGQFVLVHSYLSLSAYFLLFSSSFAESPSKHFWASTWKEIVCLSQDSLRDLPHRGLDLTFQTLECQGRRSKPGCSLQPTGIYAQFLGRKAEEISTTVKAKCSNSPWECTTSIEIENS